jgi:hypothetical protein
MKTTSTPKASNWTMIEAKVNNRTIRRLVNKPYDQVKGKELRILKKMLANERG